LEKKESFMKL